MREIVVAKLIIWQFMLVSSIPYLIEFSWADFLAYPNKCIHILINYPTDGRTHDMLCWTNFASTMKYLMLNIIKRGIWHNVSQEVSSCTTYFAAIQMTALQWHGTIFLIDAVALFKSYECTYLFNPHPNPVQFLAVTLRPRYRQGLGRSHDSSISNSALKGVFEHNFCLVA